MAKKAPFTCRFTYISRFEDYGFSIVERSTGYPIIGKSGYSSISNAKRGYKRLMKKLQVPSKLVDVLG
jgi:hypothetical protein